MADRCGLCRTGGAVPVFLPGPASSQVGFALGLMRAGWLGAVAAFVGFTLPSAIIMLAVALGAGLAGLTGVIAALKLVAVAGGGASGAGHGAHALPGWAARDDRRGRGAGLRPAGRAMGDGRGNRGGSADRRGA